LGCLRRRQRNRQTVFLDGERRPKDYEIRYNGQAVGRGYRLRSTDRELSGPRSDGRRTARTAVADTLDEAQAAFRAAGDANG